MSINFHVRKKSVQNRTKMVFGKQKCWVSRTTAEVECDGLSVVLLTGGKLIVQNECINDLVF